MHFPKAGQEIVTFKVANSEVRKVLYMVMIIMRPQSLIKSREIVLLLHKLYTIIH